MSSDQKAGWLAKKGRLFKRWKTRYFIISKGSVTYSKDPKVGGSKSISIPPNSDPILGLVESDGRYGFKLNASDGNHTLYADSAHERQTWVDAIKAIWRGTPVSSGASYSAKPQQPNYAMPPLSTPPPAMGGGQPSTRREAPQTGGGYSAAHAAVPAYNPASTPWEERVDIPKLERIEDKYDLQEQLGSGGFAAVKVAVDRQNGKQWALKQIKRKTFEDNKTHILQEIRIMRRLNHPNVVKLKEVFETPGELSIVMELMRGGELFDRILEKGSYSERDAASVLRKIVSGLHHVHSQGICHCDLKPENLIYATREEHSEIKVIDFGLSQFYDSPAAKVVQRIVGTPEYIAPEVISRKGYSASCDMWSIGVITYILLCGYYPFYGDNIQEIFKMVYKGHFEFPPDEWSTISESAKDLIRHLLVVDPTKRYTAEQCLNHPWIKGHTAAETALSPTIIENLRSFNARRRFKKGILAAIAMNKFQAAIGGIAANREPSMDRPASGGFAGAVAGAGRGSPGGGGGPQYAPSGGGVVPTPQQNRRHNPVENRQASLGRVTFDLNQLHLAQ
eukprot:tig00000655_g2880.t1